ncbi:unnamed protein product [Parajaminaea phylloscopi]
MTTLDPLPTAWYLFFGIAEPVSTVAGAVYALGNTDVFYNELIPAAFKGTLRSISMSRPSEEARMAIAQLGSCYLLLALLSLFFFHNIRRLPLATAHRETLISSVLLALGIADWVHIGVTLYFLPAGPAGGLAGLAGQLARPSSWNGLLFGNVVVTLALFSARSAWWLGVGRTVGPQRADGRARKAQ